MKNRMQLLPFSAAEERMYTDEPGAEALLKKERKGFDRKIVVLDDDPTGVQTVHDVTVFTDWERASIREGFREPESMFFILTNSRSLCERQTREIHQEIAARICEAAAESGRKFILISRGDSTLRGHFPTETAVLAQQLKKCCGMEMDGEILCPFFPEGGRYTIDNVHYVREGDVLVPAGMTEFAKDSTFGYTSSDLCAYVEEKTKGAYRAADCTTVSLEELQAFDVDGIYRKLMNVHGFQKVIVNAVAYADLKVFSAALIRAFRNGREFLIRSAAALPKILGDIPDQPLLDRKQLSIQGKNGGIVLVGSHVRKTTEQLEELRKSSRELAFLEFHVRSCFDEKALEKEVRGIVGQMEKRVSDGQTVVVYTSRALLLPSGRTAEEKLQISVRISDALTEILCRLRVKPGFLLAKGGITSSDIGTRALRVKRARVMGQIKEGIPVWRTGEESRFPGMPYIIFPGNVGGKETLREIVEELT